MPAYLLPSIYIELKGSLRTRKNSRAAVYTTLYQIEKIAAYFKFKGGLVFMATKSRIKNETPIPIPMLKPVELMSEVTDASTDLIAQISEYIGGYLRMAGYGYKPQATDHGVAWVEKPRFL